MKHRRAITLLGLGTLLFAFTACETTPATATASPDPTAVEAQRPPVKKGMTAEEVLAALGEPNARRPIDDPRVAEGEEWLYRSRSESHVGSAAVSINETFYIDPITGEDKVILDPVTGSEIYVVEREVRLYIIDGVLAGWKVDSVERADYR
jgi:hypothetical protein